MEPSYVGSRHYAKETWERTQPRWDDTETSQRKLETEQVTLLKSDMVRREKLERGMHPNEQDVGRAVIEELPEEKHKKYPKYPSQRKYTEVAVTKENVMDRSRLEKEQDMINIEKVDAHILETRQVEPMMMEERPLKETERLKHLRKAC